MKRALNLFLRLPVFGPLLLSTASSSKVDGHATDETIASRTAEIDCVKLHYMTAGHGTPLILLHGYAETSRMWKPIIPVLAGPSPSSHPTCPASETRTFPPTVWT